MSLSIWTRCAGDSEKQALSCSALRVVETQHLVSTRKLVDSLAEQELLEDMIDQVKAPARQGPEFEGLHYLLSTPFRYPPLRHGSRFGTCQEPSLWYGTLHEHTALAEVAYYRLVFLRGSAAPIERIEAELSSFRIPVATDHAIDLTHLPFAEFKERISSPTDYASSQNLGAEMRVSGVEAFLFHSARDRRGGTCIALHGPGPFGRPSPSRLVNWYCMASASGVEFTRRSLLRRKDMYFGREDFEVGGVLPEPAF